MKKTNMKEERPQTLKKRLMSALAMLLISTLLLSTTTYAWFVLSTAPEVTGIETQVGANGSLEIVLLNTETREDMSTIRAGLGGGSLQENRISANNVWGNLVDLGYTEYGLGELVLMPARLDAKANGENYAVDVNQLLAVPQYGYDGRIIELRHDAASAIYNETGFLYSGAQNYGVRAIGTSDALSPQGAALKSAKTNIATWTKSAKSGAQAALSKNIEGLFGIIMVKAGVSGGSTYDDNHKATLDAMITELGSSLDYIENSLRQGLVAYVASEISDEAAFEIAKNKVLTEDLSSVITEAQGVPAEFASWVTQLEEMRNDHALAVNASAAMTGGVYTWEQIKGVMEKILNVDKMLINGKTMETLDVNSLMNADLIEMDLQPGSGLFADIADFADNYVVTSQYALKNVEMATNSAVKPAYLVVLGTGVETLAPADGGEEASALPLSATYGYAIDLAFRCNAAMPDLVLQTKGVQRVYNGGENPDDITSESGNTQGGGSYMEFSTKAADFNLEQQLALMDAIRVAFVDDMGTIMGIAKLNVTSREVDGDVVKAPLYMYDYSFETDDVTDGLILTMGERRLTNNLITELEQNVAKAVTVVVWLDGDLVDNTMVAATAATSLNGILNLQFATSAELIPAQEGDVLAYEVSMDGLDKLLEGYIDETELDENGQPVVHIGANEIATNGQMTYTNVSWNEFMAAYQRAEDVSGDPNASQIAIRNAIAALSEAMKNLTPVSRTALSEKAQEVRETMGTDDTKIGAYVIDKGVEGYIAAIGYTADEMANWTEITQLKSVNHELNKNDEGNGIYTAKYTDATWNALAAALYQAEAVAMNEGASDDQINAALSALVEAEKALTFAVFYVPYEYEGNLYYMAKCEAEAEDTYGRWYDSNFERIVADVTILKLDAYAVPVEIAEIGNVTNIATDAQYITPDLAFLAEVFPELSGVNVKGVHWSGFSTELFTEIMGSGHRNRLQTLIDVMDTDELLQPSSSAADSAYAAALALIGRFDNDEEIPVADAAAAIKNLNDAIVDLYKTNAKADDAAMTDSLRTMLTAAVNAAKAEEDYSENSALKSATENAESLLAEGATTTNKQASDALASLNALLTNKVTEDNTLVTKLPGFDSNEFVYEANFPGVKLKVNGKSGTTTLVATVLTDNGVIIRVEKEIKICDKAEGAEIQQAGAAIDTLTLKVGETANVAALLSYTGETNADGKAWVKEEVTKYTWSSDATAVATVSGSNTATITAVAEGTAEITVSLKTDSSEDAYVVKLTVIVEAE